MLTLDPNWYRGHWRPSMLDAPWAQKTSSEIDFIIGKLSLRGDERILDIACGGGRHSIALASLGFDVVGIDLTPHYIDAARTRAADLGLDATFLCADILDVEVSSQYDVILNMYDGAIGYFPTDDDNLKLFDKISSFLRPGGQHIMSVLDADYFSRRCPLQTWEEDDLGLLLTRYDWVDSSKRLIHRGSYLRKGQQYYEAVDDSRASHYRLYSKVELTEIMRERGMKVSGFYSSFDGSEGEGVDLIVHSRRDNDAR